MGSVTSGMYGHRLKASLGMGYVRRASGVTRDWLAVGGFEIEVAGERLAAHLQLEPFYDPKGECLRG